MQSRRHKSKGQQAETERQRGMAVRRANLHLPAVKEGKRGKAGPLVEVCRPAGSSPKLSRCAIPELALVEEE